MASDIVAARQRAISRRALSLSHTGKVNFERLPDRIENFIRPNDKGFYDGQTIFCNGRRIHRSFESRLSDDVAILGDVSMPIIFYSLINFWCLILIVVNLNKVSASKKSVRI